MNIKNPLVGVIVVGISVVTAAEQRTSLDQLDNIIVTSAKIVNTQEALPIAIGSVTQTNIQLGRIQLGLDESLAVIPGLFFQNSSNFAQDQRISIRGFGSRASFGIRGIKVYADGIPLTLPDGQTSVDAIDLGSTARIEVIRGPFSSIYGASSGGVINIFTEDGPDISYLSGRMNTGSFGFNQAQMKIGGQVGKLNYLLNTSNTNLAGYRDHATFKNTLFNSKFRYDLNGSSDLTVVVNAVDAPSANDPGALKIVEVVNDRTQASPRNILFDAGEQLDQQTIGLIYNSELDANHKFTVRNYYVARNFSNRLPFETNSNGQGGSVDLQRFVVGFGANYFYTDRLHEYDNQLVFGFDVDLQKDRRKRFANIEGVLADQTTDQDEDISNYGLYVQDALSLTDAVTLTIGARYDRISYQVNDHTRQNASGIIKFDRISPLLGLVWKVVPAVNLYTNISTSFDPPTTTELANPSGQSGFNLALVPQTATNYEVGAKGVFPGRVRYELALFYIDVEDELVRYELEGPGQSFYENAGSSTHRGLETSLSMEFLPGLMGTFTYTYSDFIFNTFQDQGGDDFNGNKLPGVPVNILNFVLDYQHESGFYMSWDLRYTGGFYADNANAVKTDSYQVSNTRAGFTWFANSWEISPFVGINNIFAEEYFDNVRLNAGFGRYFEPAPGRNYFGGIGIRYNFD